MLSFQFVVALAIAVSIGAASSVSAAALSSSTKEEEQQQYDLDHGLDNDDDITESEIYKAFQQDAVVDEEGNLPQLMCHKDKEDGYVVCTFVIEADETKLNLEYCNHDDDYCITATATKQKATVVTTNDPETSTRHPQRTKTSQKTVDELLAEADDYTALGNAYRQHAMVESSSSSYESSPSSMDWNLLDVEACIDAFQKAVDGYTQALKLGAPFDNRLDLAVVQTFLAEAFSFQFANPRQHKALHYFKSAQDNYKQVLDHKSLIMGEEERLEWELQLADVSCRVASILMQQGHYDKLQKHLDTTTTTSINTAPDSGHHYVPRMVDSALQAANMLTEAIAIYRKAALTTTMEETANQNNNNKNAHTTTSSQQNDAIFYQLQLANTLHSLGNARMLSSTTGRAITVYEEARDEILKVFSKISPTSVHKTDAAAIMAELLLSLSDAYLQAGNYVHAKSRYKDAMDWHRDYKLTPSSAATASAGVGGRSSSWDDDEDSAQVLLELEQQLADYHASLVGAGGYRGGAIPGESISSEQQSEVLVDNLYEADLYSAIGDLELSIGQVELALTHLVKAIGLFEQVGGEDLAIAKATLSMSSAQLQLKEYDESARTYFAALDLYRKVVGDGQNPLLVDSRRPNAGSGSGQEAGGLGGANKAENENVFHAQLVNLEALEQEMANLSTSSSGDGEL